MQQVWKCRSGHRWETSASSAETVSDARCPECGLPGAATIVDEASPPAPIHEEKTVPVKPDKKVAAAPPQRVPQAPDHTLDHVEEKKRTRPSPPRPAAVNQDMPTLDRAPAADNRDDATGDFTPAATDRLRGGASRPVSPSDMTADSVDRPSRARPDDKTRGGADRMTVGGSAKKDEEEEQVRGLVAGYEILSELGRGGMGVVYKARQPGLKRIVALKMVLVGAHAGAEQLARFKIEAESIAQLHHPNITQVYEIGEDNGCPFFSLEYVEGDSLWKKADGTPQPPKEAARLVQSLAEAMYFAHQRGIIHRDLKPANILLTKDGVPKITDFGLAKRFEEKDEGQTRTGAIMGTPSYMAPEQAQGRTRHTGPAADIYSLGAILYDLLTGRPPFRGSTLLDTLHQVQNEEPVPPLRLLPNLPRDLDTICLKALEKDPVKRYANAGELAEDLRRYLSGEPIQARRTSWVERTWKWAKRRPAVASLVAVSVIGFVSLLTMGGLWLDSERRAAEELSKLEKDRADKEQDLRADADRQRLRAEKNFKHAKDAVDQMLSQVGQEGLEEVKDVDEIRRELLDKARIFYGRFRAEANNNDPELRYESALAMQRVADIYQILADNPRAEKAYHDALDMLDALVKEFPDREEYRHFLAANYSNLGTLLKDLKRTGEAEESYRLALKLCKELATASAAEPEKTRMELAKGHNNLGIVLQVLGKSKEAEFELEAARKLLGELALKHVAVPAYREELARCLLNLGTVLKRTGRPAAAETVLLDAVGLLRDLKEKNRAQRQQLAFALLQIGDFYRDTQASKAEEAYREAIQLSRDLATDHPRVPRYRQDQAGAHTKMAVLLQSQGKQKEADQAFDQAIALYDKTAQEYPQFPDFRKNLASAYNNWALLLLTNNRLKDGEAKLVKAEEYFAKLATDFPDVPDYHAEQAKIALNLGTVWQSLGKSKEAEASYRKALTLRRTLAEKFPNILPFQHELGSTLINLGTLLQLNQQSAQAEKVYLEARDLFTKLHASDAKNPDYAHELAVCHSNLGNLLRFQNRPVEAEKSWRDALVLLNSLVQEHQDSPIYSQELGRLYNELGILLASLERQAEAAQLWDKALVLQDKLLAAAPDRPDYRQELARSHANLGILHAGRGENEQAEASYRRAIELLEAYEAKLPVTPAYTHELIGAHTNLGKLLFGLKRITDAEKSWLRALALQEKLVLAFPAVADFHLDLARTLGDLGEKLVQREKFDDARTYLKQGIAQLDEALKTKADPFAKHLMYVNHLNLAIAEIGLGEHAGASKTIAAAGPFVPEAQPLHHLAAGLLAKCVPLAEKDAKLPELKRKELAKTYADQAMTLLQQATGKGFSDVRFLNGDDFASLRSRADFQQLLKKLEGKGTN